MMINSKIGFGQKVEAVARILGDGDSEPLSRDLTFDDEGKILLVLKPVSKEFLEKARLS